MKRIVAAAALLLVAATLWIASVRFLAGAPADVESACYGTSSNGALDRGVQMVKSGPNFSPYSWFGVALGRTYVHLDVAVVVADAYKKLESTASSKTFVYGESGWKSGGRIRPHRTHQNGTAVDFLVPVLDSAGQSVPIPANLTNRFGYGIEFDRNAHYRDYRIDFDAIAAHLLAVNAAARERNIRISRVIFDKQFLPMLYASAHGQKVKQSIPFMQGEPWIRHDEHYHIDFAIKCKPLAVDLR
jgi:penicillin-insensitive murein endopeptidase